MLEDDTTKTFSSSSESPSATATLPLLETFSFPLFLSSGQFFSKMPFLVTLETFSFFFLDYDLDRPFTTSPSLEFSATPSDTILFNSLEFRAAFTSSTDRISLP
jgi:hypothetical protein